MIEVLSNPAESSSDSIVAFRLTGKLHDEDYKTFVPMVDKAIEDVGKVRLLVQFHDFKGWDAHALWDDTKFAATHCNTIERIAIVGERAWEKYMAIVCKPFTLAKVAYFGAGEIDNAWQWLSE